MEEAQITVIGAGQAGLAAGHHLTRLGLAERAVILDAERHPGGAWQHRWESLTVGETNHIHSLPGRAFTGNETRPAREAVPAYFQQYEEEEHLHVQRPVQVRRVERSDQGLHVTAETGGKVLEWETRAIINATGTWRRPHWPRYPGQETYRGAQHHTSTYPGREWYRGKRVLVVGGGLSAVGFLLELEGVAETTWTVRTPPKWRDGPLGEDDLRRAVAEVEERTRRGEAPTSIVSATGIGTTPRILAARESGTLRAEEIFTRLTETGAAWGETEREYDAILWCTGFRAALDHLAPLRLRERGGGIRMDGTQTVREPRVHLLGYGPSASTVGATRAAREAVLRVGELLHREETRMRSEPYTDERRTKTQSFGLGEGASRGQT